MGNIYYLTIYNRKDFTTKIGSIGNRAINAGWYGYVGSSRSENFKRLVRHREVSGGENNTKHWHIDYITNKNCTSIIGSYISRNIKECQLSDSIDLQCIDGSGCSDCSCNSHLYYSPTFESFFEKSVTGFENIKADYRWINPSSFSDINIENADL